MFGTKEAQKRLGNKTSQLSIVRMIAGLSLLTVAITWGPVSGRSKLGGGQPSEAQVPRTLSIPRSVQTRSLPRVATTTLPVIILPLSTDSRSQALSHPGLNFDLYSFLDFLHEPSLRFYNPEAVISDLSPSRLPISVNNLASDVRSDFFTPPIPQAANSRIVFSSNRDGCAQIYLMNTDGSGQIRLTYNSSNDDNPRWSPNGAKILFQSDRDNPATGYSDIYVMNADGSVQTRLTTDANDDSAPVWSPDGAKIAFQSARNGVNYQVYVMNADGSGQVNISNSNANDRQPSWSPDGTHIAFASDRDQAGFSSIYVMNANGSNQTRLTFSGSGLRDEQPAWSRDGMKLGVVSTRDSILVTWQETDDDGAILNRTKLISNKEIYLMNADGTNQIRLTNDPGNDDSPAWSADGIKIIFRSDRARDCCDPTSQIMTMSQDGSNQVALSSNEFGDYSASWMASGNQSPVANAGGSYSGMATQALNLNGGSSFDPDGSIASYSWSFGDGGTGSGIAPSHAYNAAGTYNITLTVTDNMGAQATAATSANISTPNQPPVANPGSSYSGKSATSMQFNGSASYDLDGTIATYLWNFGDGANGTGVAPAHTYATAGTFVATLTVTDNGGATATAITSAVISSPSNQPPVAYPGGPYSAISGTPVQFNGTGSSDPDGTITQYQWNFADGTASGASPAHTFAAPGSHLVTLTVTDNGGATDSKSFNLTVAKTGGIHLESNPDDVGWDPGNRDSLDDPGNRRGAAPNTTTGNNNFQLVAPVLSVPGRGLNLSLNLTYNSQVWNKSASEILFDIDHDFPAPGWQLGLGKMVMMGTGGAMIIEPDGTRHPFSGTVFTYTYPAHPPAQPFPTNVLTFKGQTTDGSNIEYRSEGGYGVARYPNGTVVYYGNYTGTIPVTYLYPNLIVDSNGNVIQISYQPTPCENPPASTEPRIQRIVDTVGRVYSFHYDSLKRLTSIAGPSLSGPNTWSQTQTYVRIHYKTQALNLAGAFNGLTPRVQNSATSFSAIDAIYYPGTGKGYWFGGDAYSTYGMITKVTEERGMSFSAGATSDEQGTIAEGAMTRQQVYDYPSSPSALNTVPSFTHQTETWDGGPTSSPVTVFSLVGNPSTNERTTTITGPDGTQTIQKAFDFANLSNSDPNKFKDGLIKEQQTLDSAGHLLLKTTFAWEKGPDDAARLTRTEATDELNQVLGTNYDQYGPNNSIGRTRDYDYDGTSVIKTSINTYLSYLDNDLDQGINPNLGIRFIHPRRVNLVATAKVFTGDDSANNLAAQTVLKYDEYAEPLKAYIPDYLNSSDLFVCAEPRQTNGITGILDHSAKFNPMPFNSQNGGGFGDQYINKRGNVTSIVRYADTSNSSSPGNPITETRTYDMAGNVIAASRACCEQTSADFALPTQYAFAVSQTSGSADPNSLLRVTTTTSYDVNTGLPNSRIDANGRQTTLSYYSDSLRPKAVLSPTGAYTLFEYDDVAMKVTKTTTLTAGGTVAEKTTKYINGAGQVIKEEALGANNIIDIVNTNYDQFGRVSQQSRPYRSGETPHWIATSYDLAGRAVSIGEPLSTSTVYYNESARPAGSSADPGQTSRTIDPWGRWRWTRLNSRGTIAEVLEPNPVGGGGFATKYFYDALDNLIRIEQGDEVRRVRYDSLGRVTQQKSAEASATLDDGGTYHSSGGTWSDVFTYDSRSNVISHTDARGVKTLFSYKDGSGNDDPLNRLQSVSYDTSGVDTSVVNVLPASTVTYQYRTKASVSAVVDLTQLKQTVAEDVSTEVFDYDNEGRVQEKRLTLNGRSLPMTISYAYDNVGRMTQITYPEQYQPTGSAVRKVVTPSYDAASRMNGLKVNAVDYASQINYSAASQITALAVGTGTNQSIENYSYDPENGLLVNQNVQRAGVNLMSLSYGYAQQNCVAQNCPDVVWPKTGQITRIDDGTSTKLYTYDDLGRLATATSGSYGTSKSTIYWSQNYSYDRFGNRTQVTASGSAGGSPIPVDGPQSLSYNLANQITNPGFTYDPAGNQTSTDSGQSLVYDAAGRLVKVKNQTGATLVTYTYGSSNHRLISQIGDENSTSKTYYIWEGDSVITEYADPSGASMPQWSKNYTYFAGRLLATEEPNGVGGEIVHYHHPDRLGTRLVTNNADASYTKQVNLPFGTALDGESTGTITSRRFTSYDRSAITGLDYAVNRYYDPRQGRFTQPDPLGLAAASLTDPQSLNMYSYVGNDPMNRVDPDGQFWGALFQLISGLFHNLKPNVINGSFTYHNHAPVSVSFTPNLQNIAVGYGAFSVPIRNYGHWVTGLSPQKPAEGSFWDCFGKARLAGTKFNAEAADLINDIVNAERNISPQLLAYTWMKENSDFSLDPFPNPNGHPEDINQWDVGPFHINVSWTMAQIHAKEVSLDGLMLINVLGYNYYYSDMKTPARFSGDPLSNGRMAARRLNFWGGSDEHKATMYTKQSSRADRGANFGAYGRKFRQFFDCYRP